MLQPHYGTYHAWFQTAKRRVQADGDYDDAAIDSHMVLRELIQKFNSWCGLAGDVRKAYLQGQIDAKSALAQLDLPKVVDRSLFYSSLASRSAEPMRSLILFIVKFCITGIPRTPPRELIPVVGRYAKIQICSIRRISA